jgi:hypothetical protein
MSSAFTQKEVENFLIAIFTDPSSFQKEYSLIDDLKVSFCLLSSNEHLLIENYVDELISNSKITNNIQAIKEKKKLQMLLSVYSLSSTKHKIFYKKTNNLNMDFSSICDNLKSQVLYSLFIARWKEFNNYIKALVKEATAPDFFQSTRESTS